MSSEQTTLKVTTRVRKGQTFRPHHNLLFLACLALLLPGLLLLPFPPLRVPLELVVIFLAPGHALMKALFPRNADLNGVEQAALSFGLSVAILPVLAALLSKLPWGIRPWPMAISLSIWIAIFYSIAAMRRNLEAAGEEPVVSRLHPLDWWHSLGDPTRRKTIIGVMALMCLFIAAGFVLIIPDPTRQFSEFYMLGADGLAENYPNEVAPGEQIQIPIGITNHEGIEAQYRVEVQSGVHSLARIGPITLKDGETWENKLLFTLPESGENQQVDILLFHHDDSTAYRSLRLWINVR